MADADALGARRRKPPGTPRAPRSARTPRGSGARPPRCSRCPGGRPTRPAPAASLNRAMLGALRPGPRQLVFALEDPEAHGSLLSERSSRRRRRGRPGHETGIVGRQEHDALGDVLGDAEPADRVQGERGLARRLSVSLVPSALARIAKVCWPMSVSMTAGMDRVHAHLVALAAELERRRLGEQRHAALGQRIERIELRADEARRPRRCSRSREPCALVGAARLEMRQRDRACPARRPSG